MSKKYEDRADQEAQKVMYTGGMQSAATLPPLAGIRIAADTAATDTPKYAVYHRGVLLPGAHPSYQAAHDYARRWLIGGTHA